MLFATLAADRYSSLHTPGAAGTNTTVGKRAGARARELMGIMLRFQVIEVPGVSEIKRSDVRFLVEFPIDRDQVTLWVACVPILAEYPIPVLLPIQRSWRGRLQGFRFSGRRQSRCYLTCSSSYRPRLAALTGQRTGG